jgi:hypothetical protein
MVPVMAVLSRERGATSALASFLTIRRLLVLICTAGGLLVVALQMRLTFFNDDWWFLLQRPGLESHGGLDTLLAPHNGNIVVLQAAAYKLLVAVFGMGSRLPFALLSGLTVAVLGLLVFRLVEQRLGPVLALAAAGVVMFMGPAWEAFLFFAAMGHPAALAFGIGALLALERDTKRRNALACGLLVCGVLVFTLAIAFVVGAAVAILVVRRRPRQSWIPAVPAAAFALWWAFYGHRQASGISATHIAHLPRYVFDAVSAGLASATGLAHQSLPALVSSGHALTLIVLALLALWLLRGGRPGRWALVFAATAFAFWALTGASAIVGRGANSSRYQITGAVLVILLAAELLRGLRLSRTGLTVVSLTAVAIVASNLMLMRQGYDFMRVESQKAEADLGALQLARDIAPASLWLLAPVAHDGYLNGVTADRYFAETRAHGTPAFYSAAQIAASPLAQRQGVDSVLAAAYGLAAQGARPRPIGNCARLSAAVAGAGAAAPLRPGPTQITNLSRYPLVVGASRFASGQWPVYIAFLAPRSTKQVTVPTASSASGWRVSFSTGGRRVAATAAVCPA